jgi:predicted nucleotidyltransferase
MKAVAETYLDEATERYRKDVVEGLSKEVGVLETFVLGSGLVGGYRPGESDLDLVAVVDRPFRGESRRRAIERIAQFELPGRRLELVVYVRGHEPPDFELNLEVDSGGFREVPDEAPHWFVIDAAIAQELSPTWNEYFEPVSRERTRRAVEESLAWSAAHPQYEFSSLNAARARHYLDHGEWVAKKEAKR